MPNNAKITFVGNVVRDPMSRQAGASTVVSMSVAVSTMNKGDDGNYQSDFYDVSVWGKAGENVLQKVQKGTQVWVTGDFSSGSYMGNDGQKRFVLRVNATDVRPLARMKEGGGHNAAPAPSRSRSSYQRQDDENTMPF